MSSAPPPSASASVDGEVPAWRLRRVPAAAPQVARSARYLSILECHLRPAARVAPTPRRPLWPVDVVSVVEVRQGHGYQCLALSWIMSNLGRACGAKGVIALMSRLLVTASEGCGPELC